MWASELKQELCECVCVCIRFVVNIAMPRWIFLFCLLLCSSGLFCLAFYLCSFTLFSVSVCLSLSHFTIVEHITLPHCHLVVDVFLSLTHCIQQFKSKLCITYIQRLCFLFVSLSIFFRSSSDFLCFYLSVILQFKSNPIHLWFFLHQVYFIGCVHIKEHSLSRRVCVTCLLDV